MIFSLDQNLKRLFTEKKFFELEFEIEKLGDLNNINLNIQNLYAVSKSLNPESKIKDHKIAAYFFHKIYLKNKDKDTFYNLIIASVKSAYFEYLEPHIYHEYEKNKKDIKILEGLAKMHFFYNDMRNVTKYYNELLNVNPQILNIWPPFLASMNYHRDVSQEEYLKFCRKFNNLTYSEYNFSTTQNTNKIKVGFFSSDFKTHSVSFFLKDIISYLIQDNFEVHLLSNLKIEEEDEMSDIFKKKASFWHRTANLQERDFVNFTRSLNLDILIDLNGYTYGNRAKELNSRCAKIQISYCGYCNTLGLDNFDYIISDKNLIKTDEGIMYSEKILYLPQIWNVLTIPDNIPPIKNFKESSNLNFHFGSFNNFAKISDETISVWAELLKDKDCILFLKNSNTFNKEKKNEILINRFKKFNVELSQIKILEHKKNKNEHLECYNYIDLALDTFPYPGVTTTFESLLMGVPVLTMKGYNFNSRCGESINKNIGHDMLIAMDEKDYIQKAISFKKEKNKLLPDKNLLRSCVLKSSLFDKDTFIKAFSNLLKNLL